ncbi:MAG: hypothetical protein ABJN36_03235 [Cyclobacteriaceae bacterium]
MEAINFKVFEAKYDGFLFKIEEDYPEVGVYLYVYEGGNCIKDFLQNDIGTCKQLAFEEYQVPLDKWIRSESHN